MAQWFQRRRIFKYFSHRFLPYVETLSFGGGCLEYLIAKTSQTHLGRLQNITLTVREQTKNNKFIFKTIYWRIQKYEKYVLNIIIIALAFSETRKYLHSYLYNDNSHMYMR